jgi:hypothetical protein
LPLAHQRQPEQLMELGEGFSSLDCCRLSEQMHEWILDYWLVRFSGSKTVQENKAWDGTRFCTSVFSFCNFLIDLRSAKGSLEGMVTCWKICKLKVKYWCHSHKFSW